MTYGADLFAYLNRYWIKNCHCESGIAPKPGVYPVSEMALHVWRSRIFAKLQKKIVQGVLMLIRELRNDGIAESQYDSVLISTVDSFMDLGLSKQDPLKLYREGLEDIFISDTLSYYSATASELVNTLNASEYLERVQVLCRKELERCRGKFHRTLVSILKANL